LDLYDQYIKKNKNYSDEEKTAQYKRLHDVKITKKKMIKYLRCLDSASNTADNQNQYNIKIVHSIDKVVVTTDKM
jgi:hypothetical protein